MVGLLGVAGLLALGTWQLQRRVWKHDLIARVEARVTAPPVSPPGPDAWAALTPESAEYRHLRLSGTYRYDRTTLVQALTTLGGGYWVLTPMDLESGFTILVNRGFVPFDRRDPTSWQQPDGKVTETGLLRLSEPGGAFLRANDTATDRWYSRDVPAIAQARRLGDVAPYFVDLEGDSRADAYPVPGLTILSFPDNHLVYALTWFTLAAMLLAALVYVDRQAWYRAVGQRS